ncbi:MAG: fatty acid hydroxylase [Deltaproteobacteria bacterium]|nr:MAG: fatty acid hydroxylase [Deltaproteobacteria bacterium]
MPRKVAKDDPTRLYDSDFMERITRAHVSEPFLIYIPLVLALMIYAFLKAPYSWPVALGLWGGGVMFWTLLEYFLHRIIFHYEAKSEAGKKVMKLIHGIHHQFPNDTDRLVIPPLFAFWVIVLFGSVFVMALGYWQGVPFLAGGISGYLYYDFVHYATHHLKPRSPIGRAQRKRHLLHHYKYPDACFGVSTGFWDWVFGTTEKHAKRAVEEGRMRAYPEENWKIIDNKIQ